MRNASIWLPLALVCACTGTPVAGEREARSEVERVRRSFETGALPQLTPASPLEDYLRVAMFSSPRVRVAYSEWARSVESITVARSLPDPKLSFEADVSSMIEGAMVGLMVDLPGPGKLAAAGEAALQGSRKSYHAFESEILNVAVAVKSAYFRLYFLDENLRLQRATADLLSDLEQVARTQNLAGRVTLQDVLRAQIEKERVRTQIENLEDSRASLVAELKGALGRGASDPDPPVPATFKPSPDAGPPDDVLRRALALDPSLRAMEADVQRAEAVLRLAQKASVPDFSLGLEADVKRDMLTPSVGMTLPIWRDKIAAGIAAAQAEKEAASARLDAARIAVAAELAVTLYGYRASLRDIELLSERLVPKARQSLAAARPAYATGRASFLDVIDAERQLLAFESALIDARTRRELALAAISAAAVRFPPSAPVLEPETSR
jgi:outer membrane protein TolC